MSNEQKWSLSEVLAARQAEKVAGEPDFRVLIAITAQKLQDMMDDKYLALEERINDLHHVVTHRPQPVPWWQHLREWWYRRRHPMRDGLDNHDFTE